MSVKAIELFPCISYSRAFELQGACFENETEKTVEIFPCTHCSYYTRTFQLEEACFENDSENTVEIMRQRSTFHEDSSSSLLQDEKPRTMKELTLAKIYDFDHKYGQKTACDYDEDLEAIDRSMMQSRNRNEKRTRHRFKKRRKYPKFRFVPSLEDIQENELFETQLENVKRKIYKDLAAIHEERALGCGGPLQIEDGRRYRYKRHSRSSTRRV